MNKKRPKKSLVNPFLSFWTWCACASDAFSAAIRTNEIAKGYYGYKSEIIIIGHLIEIRNRLTKVVIAITITTILAFVFSDRIFHILTRPIQGYQLIYIDMTEMFGVYMNVCLIAGIALAMPYLVYHAIMFVSPALMPKEKKYVYLVLPWIGIMFIAGVLFSYFVLLPPSLGFLFSFGSDIATPQIRIGSYISVVTRLMLVTGVIFELPVISTFLARLGIITPAWLAGKRKIWFILAFVAGAIITPTFDPVNQTLVAAPLIVLYEASIWLAKVVQPRHVKNILPAGSPIS